MAKSSNIISKLCTLLTSEFRNQKGYLEEPQENMSIPIINDGVSYLSYSYDKTIKGKTKDLLPFLVKNRDVHSMCDYILFCQEKKRLFILLIELKKGNNEVMTQLKAGKCFAQFIISTLNRVEKLNIKPEIRLISIRNNNVVRKGASHCKDVEYDKDYFHTFHGKNFFIKEFLH